MKKIIFLCTGNSCRSQMAEGFARNMLKGEEGLIASAGVAPEGLNSLAIQVMQEVGVNISDQKSTAIGDWDLNLFELVVTVCDRAHQSCPLVQHAKIMHRNFLDPVLVAGSVKKKLAVYRQVRDDIKNMVEDVFKEYDNICQGQS